MNTVCVLLNDDLPIYRAFLRVTSSDRERSETIYVLCVSMLRGYLHLLMFAVSSLCCKKHESYLAGWTVVLVLHLPDKNCGRLLSC